MAKKDKTDEMIDRVTHPTDADKKMVKAAAKKGAAVAVTSSKKLYATVIHGPLSLRVLCLLGNLATATMGVLGMVLSVINVPKAVVQAYIFLFGCIGIVLELHGQVCSDKLRHRLEEWTKFLFRCWGRGIFYFFVGVLLLSQWGLLDIIVGAYMMVMGIASIIVGRHTTVKLNQMYTLLHEKMEGKSARDIFKEYDTDDNGFISHDEFRDMVEKCGLAMDVNEVDAAIGLMDEDHNDKVEFEEFEAWYEARASGLV